jgi:hypothetical protein
MTFDFQRFFSRTFPEGDYGRLGRLDYDIRFPKIFLKKIPQKIPRVFWFVVETCVKASGANGNTPINRRNTRTRRDNQGG